MTQASHIVDITRSDRRGACPTLHDPMQTGDGLLARLRVPGRVLKPMQLTQIAQLAQRHGNGLVEVTARGNLQVRGLRSDTAPLFANAISAFLPMETGLVVDTSPIAGHDDTEKADALGLADRIRTAATALGDRFGPKVGVVVDGGGQIDLGALKTDIRLVALAGQHWSLTLGGSKSQLLDEDAAFATCMAVLGALAAIGPDARATDIFPGHGSASLPAGGARPWPTRLKLTEGHSRVVALPFGQIESGGLLALGQAADNQAVPAIRLAPAHTLLLDGATDALIQTAAELGFVTDPADPRCRVSACSGTKGCASGHIDARRLAARLAPQCPPTRHLHVSGCAKGCAHPRPADITLVGRQDGIGLVIAGRAGDTPHKILDEAALLAGGVPFQDGR